ncbi:uncharacterized protein LOC111817637 isoform X2 [Octodon degus]|uniref:Uncharacterized protein LOC111817637 isoform X2 n=1 Tax=Octodon degus TaxID=10160 RepID=A0A6P6ERZ3_OCTDE|nr:uncharacterized protein LOC111817637 isoform X2 [Octodon degus]
MGRAGVGCAVSGRCSPAGGLGASLPRLAPRDWPSRPERPQGRRSRVQLRAGRGCTRTAPVTGRAGSSALAPAPDAGQVLPAPPGSGARSVRLAQGPLSPPPVARGTDARTWLGVRRRVARAGSGIPRFQARPGSQLTPQGLFPAHGGGSAGERSPTSSKPPECALRSAGNGRDAQLAPWQCALALQKKSISTQLSPSPQSPAQTEIHLVLKKVFSETLKHHNCYFHLFPGRYMIAMNTVIV